LGQLLIITKHQAHPLSNTKLIIHNNRHLLKNR
jgi:hypothetical protein